MTKSRRTRKKFETPQDVTVNDFANSSFSNNRFRKPSASVSFVVRKELEVKDNWDEDNCVGEHEIISTGLYNTVRPKNDQVKLMESASFVGGNEYPFDVWFLISNYIQPEDVGRFAAICKTTLAVVLSIQFWIALFKRFYRKDCLPYELQPECSLRCYGLKTSIIKALFLMYPPFITRAHQNATGMKHPDILKGLKCIGMSVRMEGKHKCYYFKFCMNNPLPFYSADSKSQSILEVLNDIEANPERNNCILRVMAKDPVPIPPIIGQTLKHVSLGLSKDLCYHRLQLMFGSRVCNISTRNNPIDVNILTMEPVTNIVILNWWHPKYLTNKNVPLLNQEI